MPATSGPEHIRNKLGTVEYLTEGVPAGNQLARETWVFFMHEMGLGKGCAGPK